MFIVNIVKTVPYAVTVYERVFFFVGFGKIQTLKHAHVSSVAYMDNYRPHFNLPLFILPEPSQRHYNATGR